MNSARATNAATDAHHDSSDSDHGGSAKYERAGNDADTLSRASDSDNESNYTLLERQRNPFLGKSEQKCVQEMHALCDQHQLDDLRDEMVRGTRLAYNADIVEELNLTQDEKHWIETERSLAWRDKWRHTWMLYYVASRDFRTHSHR